MKTHRYILFALAAALAVAGCSTTKGLSDGEYLLRSNKVKVNDKNFNASDLGPYLLQKPNSWIFGTSPLVAVYNWGGIFKKIGEAPVVYDPLKVDESINNIANHLRYLGYYGSQIESNISVSKRKVNVTYYVALGKRYKISAIDYSIPSYGTFSQDFNEDKANVSLKEGMFLSEQAIEQEAERSAAFMRTKGYYGFTKNYYYFEADTLAQDSNVKLTMSIRDYALGDAPESAREHKKYTLGEVTISKPDKLKIRRRVLETLNLLKPGDLYNENVINDTYTRLSNVNMLTGVTINTTEAPGEKVDCNISLRNGGLQGFKINLEASVNSTALIGISPQVTYYHRNLFHGGEVLNVGVKGNFQFRPRSNVQSTEVSTTASIRFPKFIGLPTRFFKGKYIPKTEVSAAFNYQDRPEFKRTSIAGDFNYVGRFNSLFSYKFTPIRLNVTRVFDMTEDFFARLWENLVLASAYMDTFDMGSSAMLYYTTDNSVVPTRPFHYVKFTFDISGNLLSCFNSILPLDEDGIYRTIWTIPYAQYVRGELQLGRTFRFGRKEKHALALRFVAGAGLSYGNSMLGSMPLEKQFYVGGAYSMRGWQARTLGPGTSKSYGDIFAIPSQVGEMKMEANIEYRFPIVWKLEGAIFADMGNIWDLKGDAEEALFKFNTNLLESIGLDWGLGIRLNLGLILVRVDGGVRIHDPAKDYGARWIAPNQWFKGNYAIHFGVGYPF